MISLLLFGFVASAFAYPHFHHHGSGFGPPPFHPGHFGPPPFHPGHMPGPFHHCPPPSNDIATNQFKEDMNTKMKHMQDTLSEIIKRFPVISDFQEGNEDNKYKITIPLTGFDVQDIVVKVLKGRLMIQAIRETSGGTRKTFSEIRNLPNTVALNGNWVYDKSTLKITFPLKEGGTTDQSVIVVPTECSTAAPDLDREDQNNENGDIDKHFVGFLDPRFDNEEAIILPNLNPDVDTTEPST